jgi:3-isopropylmalate/(R)-2-methylmalate dehydratase large subunit
MQYNTAGQPVNVTPGRVLYLCEDADLVRAQLAGSELNLASAGPLRQEISTDEISPMTSVVYFDDRLGKHPYTGFRAGNERPIGVGAIQKGGFRITVAGARYGKGSSREHSPLAERLGGIRLVIAASFERIYRQNADNIGLLTSTDTSLLDRLAAGDTIALGELVASRDSVSAEIVRCAGLLGFGQLHMRGLQRIFLPPKSGAITPTPQTLFQKIVARHRVQRESANALSGSAASLVVGDGIFVEPDLRYIHDVYTAMASHMLDAHFGDQVKLHDSATILAFEDHYSYTHQSPMHVSLGLMPALNELSGAHRSFVAKHGLRHHGYLDESMERNAAQPGSQGISHAMVLERYALPGQLIAATDSHTPHSGAIGCVAFGVGTTDMANAFMTGAVRMSLPPELLIELDGKLPLGVSAKDVMLHLLALPEIRAGLAVGKAVEFAGSACAHLSIDERATLTNMCAELGAFTGLFAPDAQAQQFVKARRGHDIVIEEWMRSDVCAQYAHTLRLDCSTLSPMVAAPGDPGRGLPLAALAEPVRIDIAYGGSCTAGKRDDFDEYHAVLVWAVAQGLRLPEHVTLYLQFGTTDVRDYCEQQGYLRTFETLGARLLEPACGACANCGPGVSTHASQVTVSAINRNFPGRGGPGSVWLASPATVAASAVAGKLVSFQQLQQLI